MNTINKMNSERMDTMMSAYYDMSRESSSLAAVGMLLGQHFRRR